MDFYWWSSGAADCELNIYTFYTSTRLNRLPCILCIPWLRILGADPIGGVVFMENLAFIATYLPSCVGTDPIGGVAARQIVG